MESADSRYGSALQVQKRDKLLVPLDGEVPRAILYRLEAICCTQLARGKEKLRQLNTSRNLRKLAERL